MKKLLFTVITLFLIISCQQKYKDENVIYLNATETKMPIDSLFDNVSLIYLNEPDNLPIGTISKILKYKSSYYLLDSEKAKAIFEYDTLGNCISKYHALGGAAGEYASILDFDIDSINDEITILCEPSKLVFTGLDLSYKREVSLKNNLYERLSVIKSDIIVFSYYGEIIEKYSKNGTFLNKINIPNKLVKGNAFFPQEVFYKTANKYLMQSPGDDNIYIENDGKWSKYKCLNYDNKISSQKLYFRKKVEDVTFNERVSNPLPYIKSIFEFKQKTYYLYLFGLLYYLNDGDNNFFFSEMPGIASLKYDKGHFYTWEYLSDFSLEDPIIKQKFQNMKIHTFGTKQEDEFNDGILLIDYALKDR